MGYVVETFLICDGPSDYECNENYGWDDSMNKRAKQLRKEASESGWVFIRGKDYCPDCYQRIKGVSDGE